MSEGNGYGWHPVTSPQRTEKALQEWKAFLESKGIETRIVKERTGFTLERWGRDHFKQPFAPGGASVGNVAAERMRA